MKQYTKTHNRRLTRREKIIVSNAGLNPNDYLFAGENKLYLFLIHKRFIDTAAVPKVAWGERIVSHSEAQAFIDAAVPKAPNVKNAPPGVSVSVMTHGA